MPKLFEREGVWYADCYYFAAGRRKRAKRSTGIKVDGSRKSKRTALDVARDIEASLAAGQGRKGRACTVRQALTCLLRRDEVKGNSAATMQYHTEKGVALLAYFGQRDIEAVGEADLIAYAHANIGAKRGNRTASRHTVFKELSIFREAWRAARTQGYIEGEPPPLPDLGTVYVPKDRWLPRTERLKLLAAINPRRRDYLIAYLRGIDTGELLKLEARDCDFAAGRYRIRGTKNKYRDRALPMDPEMREVLERRCRERPTGPLFDTWHADHRDIQAACQRAGIAGCSPKDMRRSFATDLARKGVPRKVAQALMGHGDGRMLDKVYEQFASEDLDAAADSFEQLRRVEVRDIFGTETMATGGDNGKRID